MLMRDILNRSPRATFSRKPALRKFAAYTSRTIVHQLDTSGGKQQIPLDFCVAHSVALHCPSRDMDLTALTCIELTLEKEGHEPISVSQMDGHFIRQSNLVTHPSYRWHEDSIMSDPHEQPIEATLREYAVLPFLNESLLGGANRRRGYELRARVIWAGSPPPIQLCIVTHDPSDPREASLIDSHTSDLYLYSCATSRCGVCRGENQIPICETEAELEALAIMFTFPDGRDFDLDGELHLGGRVLPVNRLTGRLTHRIPMTGNSYFVNFGKEITAMYGMTQPSGNATIPHDATLTFTSDRDTHVTVSLVYHNDIRYGTDIISTVYQHAERQHAEEPHEEQPLEELYDDEWEQPIPGWNVSDESEPPSDDEDDDSDDGSLPESARPAARTLYTTAGMSRLFDLQMRQQASYRPTEATCCISLMPIGEGDYYFECDQCKQHIDKEALDGWFAQRHHTCPHCRARMDIIPTLYRNRSRIWRLWDIAWSLYRP